MKPELLTKDECRKAYEEWLPSMLLGSPHSPIAMAAWLGWQTAWETLTSRYNGKGEV